MGNDNTEPSDRGTMIPGTVYVKITGQLFYDAIHAGQMRNLDPAKRRYRGKKGDGPIPMHSYTAWEIHPVTGIEIIPNPR